MNVAVAGDYFPAGEYGEFDAGDASDTWGELLVDYVRVYECTLTMSSR